jgi:hypothetical protein
MNVGSWKTDESCPVCGSALRVTEDQPGEVTQECSACGWSAVWQTGDRGGESS